MGKKRHNINCPTKHINIVFYIYINIIYNYNYIYIIKTYMINTMNKNNVKLFSLQVTGYNIVPVKFKTPIAHCFSVPIKVSPPFAVLSSLSDTISV